MKNLLAFILFVLLSASVFAGGEEGDFAKAKGWKKYKLKVHLTTGGTVEIKSRFNIDFCNKVMFLYDNDDNIIYPQNTIMIEREMKDGTIVKGYPTDSLWLFQCFSGKIAGYSSKPEANLRYVEYLIKGENDMEEYSLETLGEMLKDNDEAYSFYEKYVSKKKKVKLLNTVSFLVGVAHWYAPSPVKYNSTNSSGDQVKLEFPIYPVIAVGGVGVAALVNKASKKNLVQALTIYNQ